MQLLPRLNPLTKFPLFMSPPGHANLSSPAVPVHIQPTRASIVGPVNGAKKSAVTPVSWVPTPYLNKAPASQPIARGGGLSRQVASRRRELR